MVGFFYALPCCRPTDPTRISFLTTVFESKATRDMALNPGSFSALPAEALRWRCNPDLFQFETTAEIDCQMGVLGQDTARNALIFGIECDAPGQNVYVRGSRGTGRNLMVHQLLEKLSPKSNDKRDYCYVHHFERPDHPRLITLPPGTAHDFRRKIGELAEFVQQGLLKALGGEPYESKRNAIQAEMKQTVEKVSGPLETELAENGMALVSAQNTPRPMTMIFPVVEGQPVPLDQLRALVMQNKAPEQQLKDFEAAFPAFQKKLQEVSREISEAFAESRTRIDQIHEAAAREMLSAIIDPLLVEFPGQSVKAFIDDIVNNTIEYHLKPTEEDEQVDLKEVYGVNVVLCQTDKTARSGGRREFTQHGQLTRNG